MIMKKRGEEKTKRSVHQFTGERATISLNERAIIAYFMCALRISKRYTRCCSCCSFPSNMFLRH